MSNCGVSGVLVGLEGLPWLLPSVPAGWSLPVQPVPVGPGSPAAAMGDAMVTARAAAPASASAALATAAPSVLSAVMATMRPHGTRATSCVLVGGGSAGAVQPGYRQLPPACVHMSLPACRVLPGMRALHGS